MDYQEQTDSKDCRVQMALMAKPEKMKETAVEQAVQEVLVHSLGAFLAEQEVLVQNGEDLRCRRYAFLLLTSVSGSSLPIASSPIPVRMGMTVWVQVLDKVASMEWAFAN